MEIAFPCQRLGQGLWGQGRLRFRKCEELAFAFAWYYVYG